MAHQTLVSLLICTLICWLKRMHNMIFFQTFVADDRAKVFAVLQECGQMFFTDFVQIYIRILFPLCVRIFVIICHLQFYKSLMDNYFATCHFD